MANKIRYVSLSCSTHTNDIHQNVKWRLGCAVFLHYCVWKAANFDWAFQVCVTPLKRVTMIMEGNGRE